MKRNKGDRFIYKWFIDIRDSFREEKGDEEKGDRLLLR